jgi:queuine tRNA-ribosyltransferase
MSAHTLLVMHNLGVVKRFFASIRAFLASASSPTPDPTSPSSSDADVQRKGFTEEIVRFAETYDETFAVMHDARKEWKAVDMARGKGRLAREKEREDAARAHEAGVDP